MMRHIGLMIDTLNIHGGVRRCVEMANALVARGHWVTLYSPAGEGCAWYPCVAENARWDKLKRHPLDALLMFGFNREMHTLATNSLARVKSLYLVSLNETALDAVLEEREGSPTGLWRRTIQDKDWLILTCASWIQAWVAERLRPDAQLLLGGVNHTLFHPVPVKRAPGPLIMSSGDYREREGSVAVREAVELLRERGYPGARWESYFKRGIPQEQMAATIRQAHVWLDGQWYAGWANTVIEAMACRVPVVCTDIGGVRDFAIHEETALLVPVEDRGAMADAVQRILEDTPLRHRLVNNGYAMSQRFSYAAMAERLEAIIEERLLCD